MNCAIIGAGQLGSRHLQGLLKFTKHKLDIYIIDPSIGSLQNAEALSKENPYKHNLIFEKDWAVLPENIFFGIVATNSKIREEVTINLLNNHKVNLLILEKVLFTNIEAYKNVEKALANSSTKCYVNHPRRMFEYYQNLKSFFIDEEQLHYQIVGCNWGLGCNGLHFIDIMEFLSGSSLVNIDAQNIDNDIILSKRDGYIEMTGGINGKLQDGATFEIKSIADSKIIAPAISIMSKNKRVFIQEVFNQNLFFYEMDSNFKQMELPIKIKFQSELTHLILNDFIEDGFVKLTSFFEASKTHQIFVAALLKKYNKIKNTSENKNLFIT